MSEFDLITALALPGSALINRRVPKSMLVENGAPTPGDKRRIRDGIEEIRWLAVLKPTTIGVAEYRDAAREYLEIAVLQVTLRPGARADRIIELMHRAVPYPVFLIAWKAETPDISLAHKRWSQGEAAKTVVDGDIIAAELGEGFPIELSSAFCDSLSLSHQPRTTLYGLYQGWIDRLHALKVASITGDFLVPTSPVVAADRLTALREYLRLDALIKDLRAAASKENQLARQVEMNVKLKRLQADRNAARIKL